MLAGRPSGSCCGELDPSSTLETGARGSLWTALVVETRLAPITIANPNNQLSMVKFDVGVIINLLVF